MTQTPTPQTSGKAGWEDWATRTTAILAVLAALSSGRWGASNLQAILEQGKVNDAWSYYQSKSMKEHAAEQTRDLAAALRPGQSPDRAASLEQLQAQMKAEAVREAADKDQRERDAHNFEARRDLMVESSFWSEISFGALQLGVILCTIASGAKRKPLWIAGVVLGLAGIVLLINAWRPFRHAPKSWYQSSSQDMSYQQTSK